LKWDLIIANKKHATSGISGYIVFLFGKTSVTYEVYIKVLVCPMSDAHCAVVYYDSISELIISIIFLLCCPLQLPLAWSYEAGNGHIMEHFIVHGDL
jgi:hypothetical protein